MFAVHPTSDAASSSEFQVATTPIQALFGTQCLIHKIFHLDERCLTFQNEKPLNWETRRMSERNQEMLTSRTEKNLEMEWCQLTDLQFLVKGGFSLIFSAVVNGKPVAVKRLVPEFENNEFFRKQFEEELKTHRKLQHANIVDLVGAGVTSNDHRFIVLEMLGGGTLTESLGLNGNNSPFRRKKQPALIVALRQARSLADAIRYCHSLVVPGGMMLHRDLKPDNIGFTEQGQLKLLDFGFAVSVNDASQDSDELFGLPGKLGSIRYMSPEVALGKPYNHKADVYSFGIILWAMVTKKLPYANLKNARSFEGVWLGLERPKLQKNWPSSLCNLMKACWSQNISDRPNFDEIILLLDYIIQITEDCQTLEVVLEPFKSSPWRVMDHMKHANKIVSLKLRHKPLRSSASTTHGMMVPPSVLAMPKTQLLVSMLTDYTTSEVEERHTLEEPFDRSNRSRWRGRIRYPRAVY